MHPAPSLIAFTTLSGLGFGLLAFLGIGLPSVTGGTAFVFYLIAYVLAGGGLLSSTLHLGHPERALKAFSQWRSSWLSREAWLAVIALTVNGLYALGLIFFGVRIAPLGLVGAIFALSTVFGTAMIYTQLATIPRWHHWTTPVLFLAYAVAGGALLAGQTFIAPAFLVIAGAFQIWVWQAGDRRVGQSETSIATATGLGDRGEVRAFEPPHTGTNYLLTEMVHVVGRKHSMKLRGIAFLLAIILPWAILFLLPFNHALAGIAVVSHVIGVACARWLFYAEAEHVVGFYYGKR